MSEDVKNAEERDQLKSKLLKCEEQLNDENQVIEDVVEETRKSVEDN